MIYTAIYKLKIRKEAEKLFNLWGQELIDLQEKYIKTIERMLGRWYKITLDQLAKNTEVQYNDLFIDQKQFLNKEFTQDDFAIYSKMMKDGFNVWAKQLNKAFKKDINITTTFGIDPADALRYANKYAWDRIKGVDDYSKKRINALVSQGIEKGWWYKKLAEELQRDYSFSTYRARLIATQEIWEAYLNGKDTQFNRYALEYGQKGWKKWVSHRDQRTTDGCLANDNQGWIPYDQEFQSWHAKPTRFVWCRCNCVYRLFDPREDGENLTVENQTPVDTEQSTVPEYTWFDEWIKPENYDKYSTQVVPASYYNAMWVKINYIKPKPRGYWMNFWKQLNVWKDADVIITQHTEVHELWHAFFDTVVRKDEEKILKFKQLYTESVEELLETLKDENLKEILRLKNLWTPTIAQKIFDKIPKLKKIDWYSIFTSKVNIKTSSWLVEREILETSAKLRKDIGAFYDTIWAMTKEQIWFWHGAKYYRWSQTIFNIELKSWRWDRTSEMQAHEFFAHLNETYFLWNDLIKSILPKTHKAMKSFYKNIGFDDFI